jgi:hypothetical protein
LVIKAHFFTSTVFFEPDFGRYFSETLPAEMQAIFANVCRGLAASSASFYASSELSLPRNIVLEELGMLSWLVPYLIQHFSVMRGGDFIRLLLVLL